MSLLGQLRVKNFLSQLLQLLAKYERLDMAGCCREQLPCTEQRNQKEISENNSTAHCANSVCTPRKLPDSMYSTALRVREYFKLPVEASYLPGGQ